MYRCHGDIKPENILSVNGRFKIADPAEAEIEVSTTPDILETSMTGGTVTYGMIRVLPGKLYANLFN